MYKAIIYDIDGTLLNTLDMNMIPLQKIIKEELNQNVSYNEILKYASYPGMKVMEELGIKNPKSTYNRWVKYVNEYEGGAPAYDGVVNMLNKFDGKIIQAIVSSKKTAQYQIDITNKGLGKYFNVVVLEEDTLLHKPEPEPLLECLKRLSLNQNDVIYIGDALSDYLCCQKAGIDFGYATWGSISKIDHKLPKYIFNTPDELVACLLPKIEIL